MVVTRDVRLVAATRAKRKDGADLHTRLDGWLATAPGSLLPIQV